MNTRDVQVPKTPAPGYTFNVPSESGHEIMLHAQFAAALLTEKPRREHIGTIKPRFGGQLGICWYNSGERLVAWVPRSGPYVGQMYATRPVRVMCCCADSKCFRRHVRPLRRKARCVRINRRGWA